VETPGDRIVRELESLPRLERMEVVGKVLERLGMIKPASPGLLSKNAKTLTAVTATAIAFLAGVALWATEYTGGRLDVATEPTDAILSIDGTPMSGDQPRSSIRLDPGQHTLSVTSPGYARDDQTINITPRRTLRVRVKLEGSPDTGLEVTSEPPGMEVWLDGEQMLGEPEPARTNLRALRIAPGQHLLELKRGDAGGWYWRQAIRIEPGQITKVHAIMVRVPGGPS
jgi:hypothetical protein